MKRQLLPTLLVGFSCAGFVNAQSDQQPAHVSQAEDSTIEQQTLNPNLIRNDSTSQFELRQEPRVKQTVTGPSTEATTSAEAAAVSDSAQAISLRETPEPVRRHIERQAAFLPLQSIIRQTNGDSTVYEASFRGTRVQSKLVFSEAGVPLNVHVVSAAPVLYESAGAERPPAPSTPAQISQPALNRLQQQIGTAQIQSVQPRTIYEVTVEADGQAQVVWVAEDGTIVR